VPRKLCGGNNPKGKRGGLEPGSPPEPKEEKRSRPPSQVDERRVARGEVHYSTAKRERNPSDLANRACERVGERPLLKKAYYSSDKNGKKIRGGITEEKSSA